MLGAGMIAARCYECPACGGLVRAAARICRYCRSPIATIRCGLCYTMNVPEAQHCMSCGVQLGLEPQPTELGVQVDCPHCPSTPLDAFSNGDGTILDCRRCGGQFVSGDVLRTMLIRHERATIAPPHRYRAGNPFDAPVKYIFCPYCGDMMHRRNFGKVSGIVVDVCTKHGTWFDVGELARILAFVSDGGLQRASAFTTEEHVPSNVGNPRSQRAGQPKPIHSESELEQPDWSDVRDAVLEDMRAAGQAFAAWVRNQFR
jgi:Zn-finger nucleic acid-binding protein